MKRIITSSLLITMVCFLLVGCGEKKVTCTKEDKSDNLTQTETITGTFKDDKVNKLDVKVDLKLEGDHLTNIDSIYSSIKTQYEALQEDGIAIKTSKGKDSISVKITMTPGKMSSDNDLSVIDDEATADNMKKEFEELGYTCK